MPVEFDLVVASEALPAVATPEVVASCSRIRLQGRRAATATGPEAGHGLVEHGLALVVRQASRLAPDGVGGDALREGLRLGRRLLGAVQGVLVDVGHLRFVVVFADLEVVVVHAGGVLGLPFGLRGWWLRHGVRCSPVLRVSNMVGEDK